MALFYSAQQVSFAKGLHAVFSARGWNPTICAAPIGSGDGECSLNPKLRGDHDQAGGWCQWHRPRRSLILQHTGIDVWADFDPTSQAHAFIAEISEPWSAYRHVEAALIAAETMEDAITVLVERFEQSAQPARDIARRTTLANYWAGRAASEGWRAAT